MTLPHVTRAYGRSTNEPALILVDSSVFVCEGHMHDFYRVPPECFAKLGKATI